MQISRRKACRSRNAYRSRSRKACRSRKAGPKSQSLSQMIGGISGDKTRLITVNDPFGILFQDDINNDDNPETFIMKHPSNTYKEGIRAGKYEIMKIDDNHPEFGLLYAIIVTGSMDDLNRRLAEL